MSNEKIWDLVYQIQRQLNTTSRNFFLVIYLFLDDDTAHNTDKNKVKYMSDLSLREDPISHTYGSLIGSSFLERNVYVIYWTAAGISRIQK